MAWIILTIAGLLEVGWAVGLKYTEGWTRLWPSVGTAASMILSLVLLSNVLKVLPIGTAYAVWVGIGAVGVALVGMFFLGEGFSWVRLSCIALIMLGIAGLKISGPH
jgi:quaternary ammonium compound-resistance protein SugE